MPITLTTGDAFHGRDSKVHSPRPCFIRTSELRRKFRDPDAAQRSVDALFSAVFDPKLCLGD